MVRRLSSLKFASKSKKKSEGTTAEVIDITKLGSDENIKLGDPVPMVELDKINSIGRLKDIPSSDALGLTVPAYAPDEETRAAAVVLKTLQKQQPGTGHHQSSNLSTPSGEAEYFKGRELMRTVQKSMKRQKMCSSPVSATYTSHTCRFDLNNNSRHPSPSKIASRGLNKSYTQGRFTEPTRWL